jgi:hypothetical protein
MSVEERVVKWLKDGRQVGKRYSFVRDGETSWKVATDFSATESGSPVTRLRRPLSHGGC